MAIQNNLKHQKITSLSHYHGLPINSSQGNPLYFSILEKTHRELIKIIACYSRTVIVRLDLHPGKFCNPLQIKVTDFCRSFQRKLEKKYKSKVAYQWVQESGRKSYNEGFHWHIWVGVKNHPDHRPKRQAKEMYDIIMESWSNYANGHDERNHKSGWFYIERNKLSRDARLEQQKLISLGGKGVQINMDIIRERKNNNSVALGGVIDECFYALSYLAKVYSKVRTPNTKGNRVFANSNIRCLGKSSGREGDIEKNLKIIHADMKYKIDPIPLNE